MIALIQRVSSASVHIDDALIGSIDAGILLLLGVQKTDNKDIAQRLAERVAKYRIFEDEAGKMNHSLIDIRGGLLVVPQFTLAADTHKGLRPSFTSAAPPEQGEQLYQFFVKRAKLLLEHVETGSFGADMRVSLVNEGPATFSLTVQ